MDIGFGLYAPCMATCLLLGVDAQTCFPVFNGILCMSDASLLYRVY